MEADFSGWASKNDLLCTDGRTIKQDAFKHQDGIKVPLVWQHQSDGPENVLGHAILENRPEGVYAYGYFNETPAAIKAKQLLQHKDVESLSIFANKLRHKGRDVVHGFIRELSLVLFGANPGALIDNVSFQHADGTYGDEETEAIIYTGLTLEHSDNEEGDNMATATEEDSKGKTVKDVVDTMTEEQKQALYYLVGQAVEGNAEGDSAAHSDTSDETDDTDESEDLQHSEDDENNDESDELQHSDQEGTGMSRNVFDQSTTDKGPDGPTLTHSQVIEIMEDAEEMGSFKKSFLKHAEDYGITNIELLFPDAKAVDGNIPEWITRDMEWVAGVLKGVRKVPYAKIKSMSADLTLESARAKGYVKGDLKKEQFFALTKRETGPKTIYKKQRLDRDDIIDITEMNVIAFLWQEMRFMLNEEIARAILVGDGREVDDPDKIDEDKIRPIAHDDPFYTDVVVVPSNASGKDYIQAVLRARPQYKGTGRPDCYLTEDVLTDMLLLEDKMGRRLYQDEAALANALRVRSLVPVPVMEGAMTDDGDLLMILVNLSDYSVGTDKGGEITTFQQFDIDYNQEKYLIEGRMSGALTKAKRAQVLVRTAGTLATPTAPTFNEGTGVVTIPSVTGVIYQNQETEAVLTAGAQAAIDIDETLSVVAVPDDGYYFPHNIDTDWEFTGVTDI